MPKTGVQPQEGQSRFKGPRGADIFTEPRGSISKCIHYRQGENHDEKSKDQIFQQIQDLRNPDFRGPYLVGQFLQKPKGTKPSAGEPTRDHPEHPKKSHHKASKMRSKSLPEDTQIRKQLKK